MDLLPALATTNADLVDATRGPRSELGVVRVHDVQNLGGRSRPGGGTADLRHQRGERGTALAAISLRPTRRDAAQTHTFAGRLGISLAPVIAQFERPSARC